MFLDKLEEIKINELKRKIENTYNEYLSGNLTLGDVTNYFNLPALENDYEIKSIDFSDEISMELEDKKNNIIYTSRYMNSYRSGRLSYIEVTEESPTYNSETFYYIGVNNPISRKIKINNGEYSLSFESERPNDAGMYFINPNYKFTINYLINDYDGNKDTCLLSKTYQKHNDGTYDYDFERTQTNEIVASSERLDSESKHTFTEKDNVMYGVEFYRNDSSDCVSGAFFESSKVSNATDRFPSSMDIFVPSYQFEDENTLSAIFLIGHAGSGNNSHLEIYKTNKEIIVNYRNELFSNDGRLRLLSINHDEFKIPNLDEKTITSREIYYLLYHLNSHIKNDFIELITDDLLEFAKKIDIRKGYIIEEQMPLSPRLFFDYTPSEIANMIRDNKEEYFCYAKEEYDKISHLSEKEKSMTLKD